MRAMVHVKKDDSGNVHFDKNGKTELNLEESKINRFDGTYNETERIGINGINNDVYLAAKNVAEQSGGLNNKKGVILAYNPTHGMLGDLLESGADKFLSWLGGHTGTSSTTGTARNINRFLEQVSQDRSIKNLTIVGHSQGGLLLKQALEGVKFETINYENLGIQWSGAPVDARQAHEAADGAGFKRSIFQVNRPEELTKGGYPKTDFVADILGGNYQYSENPSNLKKGGWQSLGSLFGEKSPHSNYSCSICLEFKDMSIPKEEERELKEVEKDNQQLRDHFINPTLIDKDGNFRKRDE